MQGLIAFAMVLAQPDPLPERLPPVEHCAAEPGFAAFRSRLSEIVVRKDEHALLAMLADDVEVNFGGDHGPALFAANWRFNEPGVSHVWAELEEALSQGCTPSGDALVAPSFVAQFPEQLDAFDTVIVRSGTQLRSGKSATSVGKGALDWHLASIVGNDGEPWVEVALVDGRRGFVRRDETINPLDYRLVFENRAGKWVIAAFVAGD
jgi:hypothetical protein